MRVVPAGDVKREKNDVVKDAVDSAKVSLLAIMTSVVATDEMEVTSAVPKNGAVVAGLKSASVVVMTMTGVGVTVTVGCGVVAKKLVAPWYVRADHYDATACELAHLGPDSIASFKQTA
eukprot:2038018-Rhodomonas_salina.2